MRQSVAAARRTIALAVLATVTATAACATRPPAAVAHTAPGPVTAPRIDGKLALGGMVAELAARMVGARYRYGGASPAEGFDCSGLVFYTYRQAGYPVPRTAEQQFRAARKIAPRQAAAGDLMFFQDQSQLSHVGIYLGEGLFVHAPATGQRVVVARLDSPYYQRHLVAVGRLLPY